MAPLATIGGARPAHTLRAAAFSVEARKTILDSPCVLASLGVDDPGIHHGHKENH